MYCCLQYILIGQPEKNPNTRDLALLNFFSNHDRISPTTTNTVSNRKVMILKRNVNKKFSELTI